MTLSVRNLRAGYGDRAVIGAVSFELEAGEILAFFGHNGAGKSTTLKALLGLIPSSEGEVWLDGKRIDGLPIAERLASGLRLLPEGRGVFPDLSVADNLDIVAAHNCPPAGAKISLSDIYDLLPVLRERRRTIAGEMSGGQQQMLAFGLALLARRSACCSRSRRSACNRISSRTCSARWLRSAAARRSPPSSSSTRSPRR